MVQIRLRPGDANTPQEAGDEPLEFVPDLDVYLEHAMCSCNASERRSALLAELGEQAVMKPG